MAKRLLFILFLLAQMLIIKAQPNLLWTTTDNFGILNDATRDYSGNIITTTLKTSDANWKGYLNKYSNAGANIFSREIRVDPYLNGYQYKLATDKSGNIFAASEDSKEKQLLIKYSPSGDSLWAQRYLLPPDILESDYNASVMAMACDENGNVCVVSIQREYNNDGEYVSYLLVTNYSSNGNLLWYDKSISSKPYYPFNVPEQQNTDIDFGKIVIDPFNNIIISISYRWSSLDFYETRTLKYVPGNGENLPQWDKSISKLPYGSPFNDLSVDTDGNIFVEFQNAGGYPFLGGILKYSPNGSAIWEHRVAGNGNPAIAADNNGGVYVAFDGAVASIYHYSETDSSEFAQFSYPGNNYHSIRQLRVDEAGFVSASGITQPQWYSPNSKYLFIEFSPFGVQTGSVIYSSNEIYFDIPTHLFAGNGTYTAVGFSENPVVYSRDNWISKINVVPNPPPPPDPEPEKGWVLQTSGTNANLKSVWFKGGSEGWVVGDAGTILKTTNSGQEWTSVSSPVANDFKDIKFFSDTLGFIVGSGSILRTSDGGNTWTKVSDTGELTLYAITSDKNGTFVAVGSEGLGKFSTDSGLTWDNIPSVTAATLRDVEYFQTAFIAVGDIGNIFATQTLDEWAVISSGGILGQEYNSANIVDGKMYLYGTILSTLDQNIKINQSIDFPPYPLNSVSDYPNADLLLVCGENGTVGFIEQEKPAKYKTVSQSNLNDVFQSGSFCVMVGDNGTILNFNNRTRILENANDLFSSLTMINPHTFIYVASNKLYRSDDGGNNWVVIDSSGIWDQKFEVNGNTVWGSKFIDSMHKIYLSTDGGLNWTDRTPSESLISTPQFATPNGKDVIVNSDRHGIDATNVFFTSDYGLNWSIIDTVQPNIYSKYQFYDSDLIWKSNSDFSDNTYSLFKRASSSSDWEITFIDTTTYPSTDYNFYPVNQVEVLLKYQSGNNSIMYSSLNGGNSWIEYPSSILFAEYIDGRSFLNRRNFDLEMSEDGIFSHQTSSDYFFSYSHANFEQKMFGDNKKLKWNEEGQIVIENPIPTDSTQTTDLWLYETSTPKRPINSNLIVTDTIRINSGSSDNRVKNVTVILEKIMHSSIGNLTITISHLGITDTLFYQSGFSANNIINIAFNDNSPNDLQFERPPFSGEYKPFSSLDKFLQTNPDGEWILQIFDNSVSGSGSLEAWSLKLNTEVVASVAIDPAVSSQFKLSQNYPNPFSTSTIINYQIANPSHVSIRIYDIRGREVATLVNEVNYAGSYSIPFTASSFADGVYFYRLEATSVEGKNDKYLEVKKMILLK